MRKSALGAVAVLRSYCVQLPLDLPKHSQPQLGVACTQSEAAKHAAEFLFGGVGDSRFYVSAGAENFEQQLREALEIACFGFGISSCARP